MPPRNKRYQPSPLDRLKLSDWITSELQRISKDSGGFYLHQTPEKANHLDHDLLFGESDLKLEPTSTPARIWRIHPDEQLTRVNALLHPEPGFDPDKPGLRARGDAVRTKIFYGYNRIIGWIGGGNQYRNSGLAYIAPLSVVDQHGLKNYPLYYSVNSSETLQILGQGPEVLRFMAYGPDAEPYQFANSVKEIDAKYQSREYQGSRKSLFYDQTPRRPITPIYHLMRSPGVSQKLLQEAVDHLFAALAGRAPRPDETRQYVDLVNESIRLNGKEKGAFAGLSSIFLDKSALFRPEMAQQGPPDKHGRVMLQGTELTLAVNAAFSYLPPDQELWEALGNDRPASRTEVQKQVRRILEDASIRKPRILQFFRSYFDYDRGMSIDKDETEVRKLTDRNVNKFRRDLVRLEWNTDRFVEKILAEGRDVLHRLLTDDWAVVGPIAADYMGEYRGQIPEPKKKKKKNPNKPARIIPEIKPIAFSKKASDNHIYVRVPPSYSTTEKRDTLTLVKVSLRYVTTVPKGQRMGILTQPSWLLSHSDAMDNHAIHRGKWIRERLLGGAIPDVPITVDAVLPDKPTKTLRERMRVTREEYCWRCHEKMDPLGLPFEIYNHMALFRTEEKGKPIVTGGGIYDSGVPDLDGPVDNLFEMLEKLARSERSEQVFVRYAFRYWMGRNETIHDGPILKAAHRAYRDNGGSMNAILVSLLTSDAFLYRKVSRPSDRSTTP